MYNVNICQQQFDQMNQCIYAVWSASFLTLCMLGKIGFDTLYKLSPTETICMKCQILFSRKIKKNIISLSSAESAHNMVSVNFSQHPRNLSYLSSVESIISLICGIYHICRYEGYPEEHCWGASNPWTASHSNCRLLCHLLVILKVIFANSEDPDQTAPLGAVWSGSTLFACMQK